MPTRFIYLFLVSLILTSCATKKDLYYLQDIDQLSIKNDFEFLSIQPGDILDIQIKALNPESVLVFQRQSALTPQQGQLQNRVIDGYLVGEDGTISLPLIGSINTTNKNTQTLALDLQEKLSPYIKSPSVNIRLLNFRVSILGEVNKPGTFTVLEERISVLQALGLAGDLSINGNRNNITLVRSENGKTEHYTIDLTKSDFMQSPYFFLKQNDIIYVQPNTARVKSSGLVGNTSTLTSVLSLALSLIIVLTR
ncbi:MAG: polysaccharide biosynthesis/export family protein [Flavobacteriaceae bacterium]